MDLICTRDNDYCCELTLTHAKKGCVKQAHIFLLQNSPQKKCVAVEIDSLICLLVKQTSKIRGPDSRLVLEAILYFCKDNTYFTKINIKHETFVLFYQ